MMYLFGVGTGNDDVVTESVSMIRTATNVTLHELHDAYRLEITNIEQSLAAANCSVVIFVCHGSPTSLLDVARKSFMSGQHHTIFSGKTLFAHACSSALHLGRDIVRSATLYFGFDAPISGPVATTSLCFQGLRQIYIRIMSFLSSIEMLEAEDVPLRCQDILDALRSDAANLQKEFDTQDGSLLDAEELIAIAQFGRDAAIWVRDFERVFKAKGAPDRASLW